VRWSEASAVLIGDRVPVVAVTNNLTLPISSIYEDIEFDIKSEDEV
jgi:hypothetical protein